jgi:biopolymer transport protein TolQ
MPDSDPTKFEFSTFSMLTTASLPVRLTLILLLLAIGAVWCVGIAKWLQISRKGAELVRFVHQTHEDPSWDHLRAQALASLGSPASSVLQALMEASAGSLARWQAVVARAVLEEKQRAYFAMSILGSIGSTAPFVGLFGTVYGIMDAFVRIGSAKTASLPVVAPAIGEALVTTAIGLVAAIPAVLFYNFIERKIVDYVAMLEANAAEWVAICREAESLPRRRSDTSEVAPLPTGNRG